MGVRLDTDGETHQDILNDSGLARDGVEALDPGHRIDDNMADSALTATVNSETDLLLPCSQPLGRKAGVRATASTPPVQTSRQSPSSDPPGYFAAQEHGGVVHVRPTSKGPRRFLGSAGKKSSSSMTNKRIVLLGRAASSGIPAMRDHTDFIACARPHIRRSCSARSSSEVRVTRIDRQPLAMT